jgi:putative spermidine/putrescine transport system substrate-binding protein
MRRRSWLAAALGAACVPPGVRAQSRDLTVVSWGGAYQDAQRATYFRPWAAARGERLLEETWDGGIDVLRERVRSGTNTWDLVQVEGEELLIGCDEGLFEPLDPEALGGRDAYVSGAVTPCGIGAISYAFVLAWDRETLREPPRGWADFFDTARIPGRRALRRGPKTTLEIALLSEGVAPADVYRELATPAGVDRAFARLDTLRGQIAWWERGSQPVQWLAAGEVALAAAYNGRIAAANVQDGRDLGMAWSQHLAAMDFWVIMRGSPNAARALDFLRFAGQPEVQAALPPLIPYGVTAYGADARLPREVLPLLPTTPVNAAGALRIDDRFWVDNIDQLGQRFEIWLGG